MALDAISAKNRGDTVTEMPKRKRAATEPEQPEIPVDVRLAMAEMAAPGESLAQQFRFQKTIRTVSAVDFCVDALGLTGRDTQGRAIMTAIFLLQQRLRGDV